MPLNLQKMLEERQRLLERIKALWYSKTSGKAGYRPVCENEWDPHLCDRKQLKCADCANRQFSPLTDDDVYRHLEGKDLEGRDVIGLYVLNEDNTCHLLCTDFDDKNCEHGYHDDVLAFTDVCNSWHIPCSVERSRSGNGAHVWIFFESPVPAIKARRLGNAILTEAMERNGTIGFKSYDRFFPNQDTLPEGGLGNLVALPLQGNARKNGNSVFVNEYFEPYPDQWEYLHPSAIQSSTRNRLCVYPLIIHPALFHVRILPTITWHCPVDAKMPSPACFKKRRFATFSMIGQIMANLFPSSSLAN